jgi:hypothetical protein
MTGSFIWTKKNGKSKEIAWKAKKGREIDRIGFHESVIRIAHRVAVEQWVRLRAGAGKSSGSRKPGHHGMMIVISVYGPERFQSGLV